MAGIKRHIGLELFNIFLKNKYLISYEDSKLIKVKSTFKLIMNCIELCFKNEIKIIKRLNSDLPCVKKEHIVYESKNVKNVIEITAGFANEKSHFQKIWEFFLRVLNRAGIIIFTATLGFASELILGILRMFKYEPI